MLEDLKAEVVAEGTTEEANYKKFADFCSTTQKAKEDAVKLGEDKSEEHTAGITQKTSSYEETLAEIGERKTKGETLSSEKEASMAQCKDDQESFESSEADLAAAVVGLESAISKVTASKGESLVQLGHLQKSLDLAEALGFLQSQKKAQTLTLLQGAPWLEEAGAEYNKKDYAFQSAGVVSTLQDLLKEFREERSKGQEEWKKTKQACSDFETSRSKEISENSAAIASAETTAATLKGEVADGKQLLLETQNTLKDDRAYLDELKTRCSARESDFQQRSQMRSDETKAIEQAIQVMKEKAMTDEAASFLQTESHESHESQEQHVQATARRASSGAAYAALRGAAAAALQRRAAELQSRRLAGLALRMQRDPESVAVNPLQAVKDMVQGLVNQLLEEAAKQATQKGFCDSAMGKATMERDRRLREAKKLSAKLGALHSKRSELLEENELLKDEVAKLEKDLLAATDLRTDESKENLKEIKEAQRGFEATKEAIETLVAFYKSASRKAANHDKAAAVLVQTAEEPEAGFEGSYGGKQTAAKGVISMLEVVRDDFEKSASTTKDSEDKAADEFSKLKLQSKTDIAGKTTQKKLNEEELENAENELKSGKTQLQTTMDLLDGALRTLEDLKPQCVDSTMSYEERKAKREEELEALKTAMCTLDKEGVEPMCKK